MGGYFTFNVKAIAMRIAKIINLMYFCITTTPFREWHNRRPPFFRRKAEPKNLKQKELSFKLRMKSCPAGITPGRLYYTAKKPICQYRFRRRERLFYACLLLNALSCFRRVTNRRVLTILRFVLICVEL